MLRIRMSESRRAEDFVALPSYRKIMPARHLTGIFLVVAGSFIFALQNPTLKFFPDDIDSRYLSEGERSYLMAAEQVVELPTESTSLENYEDYDIPSNQFVINPVDESSAFALKIPIDVNRKAGFPKDLISITPLKDDPFKVKTFIGDRSDSPVEFELDVKETAKKAAPAVTSGSASSLIAGTWYFYKVERGENLSQIFRKLALPMASLTDIVNTASDSDLLLNIGDELHFNLNADDELLALVKPRGSEQVRFSRSKAGEQFVRVREQRLSHIAQNDLLGIKDAYTMPGAVEAGLKRPDDSNTVAASSDLRPRLIICTIESKENFDKAGKRAGLTASEIRTIKSEFKGRYDLSRLSDGDTFRILFNGLGTRALINAVEFKGANGSLAIFRNPEDRGFYTEGEYVPTAGIFRRFPLADSIKISSKFNPSRKHPVTGKITPHKGVDFRAPIGTPVYAPADGTVTFAGYQRAAGYYIIIKHLGDYSTVYMHLSKMDVKKGDRVNVGQVIARTGNTGRTTGPHLHYEVRIKDKAADPLSIKLPSNSHPHLAREQREAFESNIKIYKTQLHTDSLALRQPDNRQ